MLSHFFIDRPVFAGVLAIVMVLIGALSATQLAVEQYPEIAPPTVQVSATYPGADAKTIAETVAAPLEQEVNGTEGMIYMSSISSDDGSYKLTISFELGTDLDLASVRVQNMVSVAEPRLPEEVRRQGITTSKQSPSLLMLIAPHSPDQRFDQIFLSNYTRIYLVDRIARVPGVGSVQVFDTQQYAMRVWIDPEKLAARDLTTAELVSALASQNVQVAAGKIGQAPNPDESGFQITITTKGRLQTAEEFENTVLKVGSEQRVVLLKDVARVELGAESYDAFGRYNGQPAPIVGIYQLPGSNALDVAQGVRAALEELSASYPEGFAAPVFYDFTDFVTASLEEVITTLIIASILVVLTVYFFLQDFRATLVPGIAIPVSIIGALALLLAMGFGLNMLTLFGLVLAIGIVVDDAIVVVENTTRLIEEKGMSARDAARESMLEITGPVIATTLVLLAVFVPTAVLPGITGQLYRQFGVTLSVATVLSSVNALTLSPALCALLLRKSSGKQILPFRILNNAIDASTTLYGWTVSKLLRLSFITVLAFGGTLFLTGYLFQIIPTGFVPLEDQKYFFVNVSLPPAAKIARTAKVLTKVEDEILNTEGVAGVVTLGGNSLLTGAVESSTGSCVAILDDWSERKSPDQSVDAIVARLGQRLYQIPEAMIFPFLPPPIMGLGQSGGFDLRLQDREGVGLDVLEDISQDLVAAAAQSGIIDSPFTSFSTRTPQIYLDIDRLKAQRLGVSLDTIFSTLSANLGSAYVNDFNMFGRTYQVRVQAEAPFRSDPDDILRLKVRDREGNTLPLRSVASLREQVGASTVFRYNMYAAASITGSPIAGRSSGEALATMDTLAEQTMPNGFGYEWTGTAFQERQAGNVIVLVFALSLVFVYLFLAAQYESWILPFTIMATIPIGVVGALAATLVRGMDNNVYTQIGLVLLVALVCKNAILIVEFAEQLRKDGKNVHESTVDASKLRFRPILMTALSFVLGTAPLLIATGAGASSRLAIGTAVFGGMVLATFVGVLFIPALYGFIRSIFKGSTSEPKTAS
ncbi:MAG: efflux RND transporter permease subunit [Phycisphaerae bacterium]